MSTLTAQRGANSFRGNPPSLSLLLVIAGGNADSPLIGPKQSASGVNDGFGRPHPGGASLWRYNETAS